VEPDYLPDFIGLCFQSCLYPMKTVHPEYCTPLHTGGAGGVSPPAGSRGLIPPVGGSGGSGASPRRKNFLVNVYCNFIVNLDHSL
jgi:hypothetical protein